MVGAGRMLQDMTPRVSQRVTRIVVERLNAVGDTIGNREQHVKLMRAER